MSILGVLGSVLIFLKSWINPFPEVPKTGTLLSIRDDGMYSCGYAPVKPGFVLTASHCTPSPYDFYKIIQPSEDVIPARPIWASYLLDMSLVAAPHNQVNLVKAAPQWGEKVCFRNNSDVVKCGRVGLGENAELSETSLTIRFIPEVMPGDSGSPVLNAKGEVVGLISAYTNHKPPMAVVFRVDAFDF